MKKDFNNKLKTLDKKIKKIKARDMMTEEVITIGRNEDLYKAADLMIKNRISGIPVVSRGGKIQGIITENDLFMVMDMVKSGDVTFDNNKKGVIPPVNFAMSVEVNTITKDTTLDEIIVLMKYKNQHTIPVLEKGKLVGIIGKQDVFKKFYSAVKSC
ncbi:MAG: CBS domain-containing protein [Candidatus Omnitrophica bacterium]|nr:CBS domain-containing protein [Candidatus Omnitrophota bacterium]